MTVIWYVSGGEMTVYDGDVGSLKSKLITFVVMGMAF